MLVAMYNMDKFGHTFILSLKIFNIEKLPYMAENRTLCIVNISPYMGINILKEYAIQNAWHYLS